jgi:hypothetical protein
VAFRALAGDVQNVEQSMVTLRDGLAHVRSGQDRRV